MSKFYQKQGQLLCLYQNQAEQVEEQLAGLGERESQLKEVSEEE